MPQRTESCTGNRQQIIIFELINTVDIAASLTDTKLYNSEFQHRKLNIDNLKKAWKGTFEVEGRYIDEQSIGKIKWNTNDHIDYTSYMLKPTLFFISDDLNTSGINVSMIAAEEPTVKKKKSKRLMDLQPVKNAINLAALKGYSFRFYDPDLDSKYVRNGDVVVWMGEKSKNIAEYLDDGFDVRLYRAKEIKRELSGLHDYYKP